MKRRQKKFKDFNEYLEEKISQEKSLKIEEEIKIENTKIENINKIKNHKGKKSNPHKFKEDNHIAKFVNFKYLEQDEIFDLSENEEEKINSSPKQNKSNEKEKSNHSIEQIKFVNNRNELNTNQKKYIQYEQNMIDQMIIGKYIELILENFNKISRHELISKIMYNNFDIEKVLLEFYNKKCFKENINKKDELLLLNQIFPTLDEMKIEKIYKENQMDYCKAKNYIINNVLVTKENYFDINYTDEYSDIINENYISFKDNNTIKFNNCKEENHSKLDISNYENNDEIKEINFIEMYQIIRSTNIVNLSEYYNIIKKLIIFSILLYQNENLRNAKGCLNKAKKFKNGVEYLIKTLHINHFIFNNIHIDIPNILLLDKLCINEIIMIIKNKIQKLQHGEDIYLLVENQDNNYLYNNSIFYPDLIYILRNEFNLLSKGFYEGGYILTYNGI